MINAGTVATYLRNDATQFVAGHALAQQAMRRSKQESDRLRQGFMQTTAEADRARARMHAFGGTAAELKQHLGNLVGGYAAVASAMKLFNTAMDEAREGVASQAFQNLGGDLAKLRTALKGLVDDDSIVKITNHAHALGLTQSQVIALAGHARTLARVEGTDVKTAFEEVTAAVASGNAKRLKQMGIMVDLKAAEEKYAKSLGVTTEQLGVAEKQTVAFNAVMAEAADLGHRAGVEADTAADRFERFQTRIENLKSSLSELLIPAIEDTLDKIEPLMALIEKWGEMNWAEKIQAAGAGFLNLLEKSIRLMVPVLQFFPEVTAGLVKAAGSLPETSGGGNFSGEVEAKAWNDATGSAVQRIQDQITSALLRQKKAAADLTEENKRLAREMERVRKELRGEAAETIIAGKTATMQEWTPFASWAKDEAPLQEDPYMAYVRQQSIETEAAMYGANDTYVTSASSRKWSDLAPETQQAFEMMGARAKDAAASFMGVAAADPIGFAISALNEKVLQPLEQVFGGLLESLSGLFSQTKEGQGAQRAMGDIGAGFGAAGFLASVLPGVGIFLGAAVAAATLGASLLTLSTYTDEFGEVAKIASEGMTAMVEPLGAIWKAMTPAALVFREIAEASAPVAAAFIALLPLAPAASMLADALVKAADVILGTVQLAAETFGFDELAEAARDARNSLRDMDARLERDAKKEAIKAAKDEAQARERVTDSLDSFGETLTNVPTGYKVAGAINAAANPELPGGPLAPRTDPRAGRGNTFNIGTLQIMARNGRILDQLNDEVQMRFGTSRGGGGGSDDTN